MADAADGTKAEARSWRQKAAFWLMLALAAYWIAGGVWWVVDHKSPWTGITWPVVTAVLTAVAAFGTRKPNTGWQLFARIVLVGPLLGRLILHGLPDSAPSPLLIPLLVGMIAALVLLGRSGLGPDGGPFAPTRFRGLLIFMILAAGLMAFNSFQIVVEGIGARLRYPDSYSIPWEFEARRVAYLFAYVVTAFGLYRMRAAALLIPLLLGGYLLYRAFLPHVWSDGGGQPSQHLLDEIRWDGIRYASFVLLMVVPFMVALARLRIQARKRRYSSGQEKSPPKTT